MSPVIYFVRHGETDWNVEARLQGQRDIPLNDFGRVLAEEAGLRLRTLVPRFEELAYVASPLGRTRETMERLREAAGLAARGYRTDERLRELTFGIWEGRTWAEIRAADPDGALARERDKWGFVPPGGESYGMLAGRIGPFFDELDRDTVVVSHGGVARALLALRGLVPTAEAPRIDIWQGRILVFADASHVWA